MRFEFSTPPRIVIGPGCLRDVGAMARSFGGRALVVTGRTPGRAERLLGLLREAGVQAETYPLAGEPTTTAVEAATAQARAAEAEMVIGFGGGSAIDAAKAVAALLANREPLEHYLEVIGRAQPLQNPALPCIAIPTTSGAGAEATRNSVLISPSHRLKVSLRSPYMMPRVALVDSELTHALPPDVTAATGMDALTQLIEPYVGRGANPMTDLLCLDGFARVVRSLRWAYHTPSDAAAREDMSLAGLYGGIALANAGLGAVHGFAAPIGGRFTAPHGAVCAALLPAAIELNVRALRSRDPESRSLSRYGELARLVMGIEAAMPEDLVDWTRDLATELRIPTLKAFGISAADAADVIPRARGASSMKGNPIVLTDAELSEVFAGAL